MKITGKLTGQIEKLTVKINGENDGQTANADLVVRFDRDSAASVFGDEFAEKVAFAGLVERTDEDGAMTYAHLISGKPTAAVVIEMHEIKILGRKITGVQPSLFVRPVEGEAKVDVIIRCPVDVGSDEAFDLALVRAVKIGSKTKAEFNPQQGDLGFEAATKKRGRKVANDDDGAEAEASA